VVGPEVPGAELCIQILGFPSQGAGTGYVCTTPRPGGHFAVEKGRSSIATHERRRRWLTETNAVVTMLIEIEQLYTQRPMYFVTTAHLHTADDGLLASLETQFLSEFSAARMLRPGCAHSGRIPVSPSKVEKCPAGHSEQKCPTRHCERHNVAPRHSTVAH
jgi:hypothetical protein